jgi:poly(3-hydroxybutyrate) depolymerase
MDLPAEFFLQTVSRIFQQHALPRGTMTWKGQRVDPSAIRHTALLTVEGEMDDISAPGQTRAAHRLCRNIPAEKRADHLQKGVGHYGIFNGRRWREQILPRVRDFILTHDTSGRFTSPAGHCRESLGVRWWAGYDRLSFWLAGDQEWGGFCAWWKPGSTDRAGALT